MFEQRTNWTDGHWPQYKDSNAVSSKKPGTMISTRSLAFRLSPRSC
jgi:hypothetical protein